MEIPTISAEAQLCHWDFYFIIKNFLTTVLFIPTFSFTEHC